MPSETRPIIKKVLLIFLNKTCSVSIFSDENIAADYIIRFFYEMNR